MLDRYFHQPIHQYIYWIGAFGIAVGLSTSLIVLSLATMLLSANFLLEGAYKEKIQRLFSNKLGILLLIFFLFHVFGVLWSSNTAYGWHDIKVKLPLLSIPVVLLGMKPFSKKINDGILLSFVIAVVITSFTNWLVFALKGFPGTLDTRELSLFGSHIRFALLVAFALGCCIYYLIYFQKYRWIAVVFSLWFIYYTIFAEVLSGYLCIIGVFLFTAFWAISLLKKRIYFIIFSSGLLLLIGTFLFFFLQSEQVEHIDSKHLPAKTLSGNEYSHHPELPYTENGHYVFVFLCHKELRQEWEKVSKIPYDSTDEKGQPIYGTLSRYMTSKGLHKDSVGFSKLSLQDIINVEDGIASITYLKSGLFSRFKKIRWELQKNNNPNGHSILQRLEYWKTAWKIIQENSIIGVGTGDVDDSFQAKYTAENSVLTPENRLRAHQQLLTIWVSFGIIGLFLFVAIHVVFAREQSRDKSLIGFLFLVIILISYLSEDTLETQVGITFFSFFIAFFAMKKELKQPEN